MSNAPSPYILYGFLQESGQKKAKIFAHSQEMNGRQECQTLLLLTSSMALMGTKHSLTPGVKRYQQRKFHSERSKEIGFFKSMSTATMANLLVLTLPIFAQKLE